MPLSYTLKTHSSIKSKLDNQKAQLLKIGNFTSLAEIQARNFTRIFVILEKCAIPSAENSKPLFQPVASTVKFDDLQIDGEKKESVEGALVLSPPCKELKFRLRNIKPMDEDDVTGNRKLYRFVIVGKTEQGLEQRFPASTSFDRENLECCFFLYNAGGAITQLNIGLKAFGLPQIPITTSEAANNDERPEKRARVGSSSTSESKRQKTDDSTKTKTKAAPTLQTNGSPPAIPPPSTVAPKPPYSMNNLWSSLPSQCSILNTKSPPDKSPELGIPLQIPGEGNLAKNAFALPRKPPYLQPLSHHSPLTISYQGNSIPKAQTKPTHPPIAMHLSGSMSNTKSIKATASIGPAPFSQSHDSPPSTIAPKPPYSTNIPCPALHGSSQAASIDPGDMRSIFLLLQQLPLSRSAPNMRPPPALPKPTQDPGERQVVARAGNAVASLSNPPDRGPSAHCWHPTASHHDDNIQWHSQASPAPFSTTSHSLASRAAVEEQKQREALCPPSDPPNYMMDFLNFPNDDTEPLSFLDTAKPSTSVASLQKPPDIQSLSHHSQDTQSTSTPLSTTADLRAFPTAAKEQQQREEPYHPSEPPNEYQGSDGGGILRYFHNNTTPPSPHNTAFQIEPSSSDEQKEPPSPQFYPPIEQLLLFQDLFDKDVTKDPPTKICQPASSQMTPFN